MDGPYPDATRDWIRRYEARLDRGEALDPARFLAEESEAPATLLETLEAIRALRSSAREDPGETFGPYAIEREIGRGAQGIVYAAKDTRLGRRVALKVLEPGRRDLAEFYLRFRREAAAAGRLEHPSICSVYESGVEAGRPFIAMQYIAGETLARRTSANGASTRSERGERVVLVEKVALALHAAHESGLVHRDIKPGNIMVTAEGEPIVCDFGLAQTDDEGDAKLTRTGDVRGTPAYMAPEQVTGLDGADARTDVYALGVILYELLAGSRPYEGATWALLMSNILAGSLERPTSLPGPLWVIVQTALAREPAERYATALDFAEDLRRFREHRPIRARRPSAFTRLTRLVRRNRAVSAAAALLFVGAIGFGLSQASIAERERNAGVELEHGRRRANSRAYAARIAAAGAYVEAHRTREARIELRACAEDLRGWEWHFLQHATDDAAASWVIFRGSPVHSVVVSADGSYGAMLTKQRLLRFEEFGSVSAEVQVAYAFARLVISPLGSRLAATTNNGVEIFDPQTMKRTHRLAVHVTESKVLVFLGEHVIASGDAHGTITAIRIADGAPLEHALVAGELVTALAAVPGTEAFLAGTESGRVIRFDPRSGTQVMLADLPWKVADLAVQGDELLVGCAGGAACVLDLHTGEKRVDLVGHRAGLHGVCFFGAGYATISNADSTLRTWSRTGEVLSVRVGHEGFRGLAPWRDALVTSGGGGTVRLCRAEHRPASLREGGVGSNARAVAMHPSAPEIAVGDTDGRILVFDIDTRLYTRALKAIEGAVLTMEYSPDGRWLAAAGEGRCVQLFNARTYEPVALLRGVTQDTVALAWRPDSSELAAASSRGTIRIFDALSHRQVAVMGSYGQTKDLVWHPDGDHLLLASPLLGALLYRRSDGTLLRRNDSRNPRQVLSVDVSPDGTRFLMAIGHGVQIRDFESGSVLATVDDQRRFIRRARYAPDGRRIATSDTNSILHIRDADTAETLLVRPGLAGVDMTWSPDGVRLVAVNGAHSTGRLCISEIRRPEPREVDEAARARDRAVRSLEAPAALDRRLRAKTLTSGLAPEIYREVLAEIQIAHRGSPHAAVLGPLLAGAHYRCGNYDQALRLLRKAYCRATRTSQGRDERIGLWRAMTLARLGDAKQAREVLRDAIEELKEAGPVARRELAPLVAEATALLGR